MPEFVQHHSAELFFWGVIGEPAEVHGREVERDSQGVAADLRPAATGIERHLDLSWLRRVHEVKVDVGEAGPLFGILPDLGADKGGSTHQLDPQPLANVPHLLGHSDEGLGRRGADRAVGLDTGRRRWHVSGRQGGPGCRLVMAELHGRGWCWPDRWHRVALGPLADLGVQQGRDAREPAEIMLQRLGVGNPMADSLEQVINLGIGSFDRRSFQRRPSRPHRAGFLVYDDVLILLDNEMGLPPGPGLRSPDGRRTAGKYQVPDLAYHAAVSGSPMGA